MTKTFPRIMGIVNVTPDSFSDGGQFASSQQAVEHALKLVASGADILDVGGESTRPGSDGVSAQEERNRVIPVITGIREVNPLIPISVDTTKSDVALAAIDAGATMVNDVSGGRADDNMLSIVAKSRVDYVLMHMKGTPQSMQDDPAYINVVDEVAQFLRMQVNRARDRGVENITVDPGIGFGKTADHNIELLRNLEAFTGIGDGLLVGVSRKRFLGSVTGVTDPAERDVATVLTHALLLHQSVGIIRVHNVSFHAQLRSLASALG